MKSKGIRPSAAMVHTVRSLLSRTEEVGECLEWQGYIRNNVPQVYHAGRIQPVRRLLLQLGGQQIPATSFVGAGCKNQRCVCPEHAVVRTSLQHRQYMARTGAKEANAPDRIAKLQAIGRQRNAKLTLEQAREIRSSDGPAWALAERYGVNKSTVTSIRRGERWRETGLCGGLNFGGRP